MLKYLILLYTGAFSSLIFRIKEKNHKENTLSANKLISSYLCAHANIYAFTYENRFNELCVFNKVCECVNVCVINIEADTFTHTCLVFVVDFHIISWDND